MNSQRRDKLLKKIGAPGSGKSLSDTAFAEFLAELANDATRNRTKIFPFNTVLFVKLG